MFRTKNQYVLIVVSVKLLSTVVFPVYYIYYCQGILNTKGHMNMRTYMVCVQCLHVLKYTIHADCASSKLQLKTTRKC